MDDVVKICVAETYKVKVEAIPIYDTNVISDVETNVKTSKNNCLWVSELLEIKNVCVLAELSNILASEYNTYVLPRDWVDLNSHTDRYDIRKTEAVIGVLQSAFPDRTFVAEKSHRKLKKFKL